MHNNKFEKKMEQCLEELSFSPSPSVWDNVELQLKQRKERRRFLFWWLPVALLCISTAGWFAYNAYTSKPNQSNKAVVNKVLQNTEPALPSLPITSATKEKTKPIVETSTPEQKKTAANEAGDRATIQPTLQPTLKQKATIAFLKPVKQQQKNTVVKKIKESSPVTITEGLAKKETDNTTNAANKQNEPATGSDSSLQINNTIVQAHEQQKKTDSAAIVQTDMPTQKETPVKKKRFEWYAKLGTGRTSMSQFSTEKFSPFSFADSYSGMQASPGTGSSSGSAYSPSTIKPGIGFTAGAELRTIAKKRSAFSVGLNYGFYSTSIKTGSMVFSNTMFNVSNYNSSVTNYMRAGNSSTFHNHYHFMELPVLYHLRLTKPKKHPLLTQTGLSYNYLIASNSNYYSATTGAYYFDNKLFNRSQLRFHIGLSSAFIKKQNYPLQVALQYQAGVTGQWKKTLPLNQHLTHTGIEILWRLKK